MIIWTPIDRLLWGIAISIFLIAGIKYLKVGRERETVNEKLLLYGFSSIFFGMAVYRAMFFLAEFLIQGTFRDYAFYGNYENVSLTTNLLFVYAMISLGIGLFLFIFFFELSVKRTRFILSIISFSILTLVIIYPYIMFPDLNRIVILFVFVFIFVFILLYLTKYSQLEFKAISSLFLFGLTLILLGIATSFTGIKKYAAFPTYIAPLLVIAGTIICTLPTFLNPKVFSQALAFWIIIGILTIIITLIVGISIIVLGAPSYIGIAFLVFILMLVFLLYKAIKMTKKPSVDDELKLLSMFTKPQRLTEEEVTVSKERKICLVCKGKLSRMLYMCPDCMAIYCEKCSIALSNIENACWVCETAIDESKPVKIQKKEEDIVKIEEKVYKKIGK